MIQLDWSPVQRRKAEIAARKRRMQEQAEAEARRMERMRKAREDERRALMPGSEDEARILARQNQNRDYGHDMPTVEDHGLSGAVVGFEPERSEVPQWLLEMRRDREVEVRRPRPPDDTMSYRQTRRQSHEKHTTQRFAAR